MANDVTILAGLIAFFLILAIAVPVIEAEFDQDTIHDYDSESLDDYDEPDTGWFSSSFSRIILNLYSFLFWTFGIPAWVNLSFLLMMRFLLAFLFYRAVRSGGG